MSVNIELAKRMAVKRAGQIRLVGELWAQDVIVLENRLTGERRRLGKKQYLMAGTNNDVAFELATPYPGFEDEQPSDENDE